jgi:hypothetical protein
MRLILYVLVPIVIFYGVGRALPLLTGPQIFLNEISTNEKKDLTTLRGIAKNTKTLTLNGDILFIDASGKFETSLTLPSAGVILYMTAVDRFGRKTTLSQTVLLP